MKKIVFLFIAALVSVLLDTHISMVGDRSANPTYVRMPKVTNSMRYSLPTQQSPSLPSMPTQPHMILNRRVQTNSQKPITPAYNSPAIDDEGLLRQKEIAGYTHMYGTSDTYNSIELIR